MPADRGLRLKWELVGQGKRRVPVPTQEHVADETHAELGRELAVAPVPCEVEALLGAHAPLLVAIRGHGAHGEVVVGAKSLRDEIVLERDRERLLEERTRLVSPSLHDDRFRIESLREDSHVVVPFGHLERELDPLDGRLVVALEVMDPSCLGSEEGDVLVGLVSGKDFEGRFEQLQRLGAASEGPQGEAEPGRRPGAVVRKAGALE